MLLIMIVWCVFSLKQLSLPLGVGGCVCVCVCEWLCVLVGGAKGSPNTNVPT